MAYTSMEVIETSIFVAQIDRLLSGDELAALHLMLALHPDRFALMRGSGGCRMLRWALPGSGK
ncbi:MAG TPA: hypothetical protein VFN22_00600 [Gemmatimonadales bacterium]|nr:hypothetical protein [Gemmatimonadales bacterium]